MKYSRGTRGTRGIYTMPWNNLLTIRTTGGFRGTGQFRVKGEVRMAMELTVGVKRMGGLVREGGSSGTLNVKLLIVSLFRILFSHPIITK